MQFSAVRHPQAPKRKLEEKEERKGLLPGALADWLKTVDFVYLSPQWVMVKKGLY